MKPENISETAHILIRCMSILFISPTVSILSYWGVIAPDLVPILVIVISSAVVVFAVSGLITKALLKKGGEDRG